MDDFLEPHKLKCMSCRNVFMTVLPIGNIKRGDVPCPKCGCTWHGILDEIRKQMEDKNMKRTENEEQKDKSVVITRRCDTSRGIFTVGQLEPTDLFVLIDDEDQTVYMAVYEEEPKYKTKQAVVDMQSGKLLYLGITTKIHVYRAGCELRVGDFIWSSEGYN